MVEFQTWADITYKAFSELLTGLVLFIPKFLGAVIFFFVGWFIATWTGILTIKFLGILKFNQMLERLGWKDAFARAELKFDLAAFIGEVVKWVIALVFLAVAAQIAGLKDAADFLNKVVGYLPNLIVAAFILVITIVVADLLERIVRAAMRHAQVGYISLAGSLIRWGVWIFGFLAILEQLKIAPALLQTLTTGLIAMFALAFGIAFGFGGKEVAGRILEDIHRKISNE